MGSEQALIDQKVKLKIRHNVTDFNQMNCTGVASVPRVWRLCCPEHDPENGQSMVVSMAREHGRGIARAWPRVVGLEAYVVIHAQYRRHTSRSCRAHSSWAEIGRFR